MSGLRQAQKRRTRAALETAALDLFERKVFEATTAEEVASAVNVSPRTLYRYFPTKHDLIFASSEDRLHDLVRLLADRPAGECPLLALRNALVEFAPLIDNERTARRSRLIEATPQLRERRNGRTPQWGIVLAEELARREGAEAPDARLQVAADLAHRMLERSIWLWRDRGAARGTLAGTVAEVFSTVDQLFEEAAAA